MQRFDNVDVFASLNALMRQNTGFYQSDLEIDKEIIARAAASPDTADKTLLWLSRPSGTYCFKERDVFGYCFERGHFTLRQLPRFQWRRPWAVR
jgi:hypothetical protein